MRKQMTLIQWETEELSTSFSICDRFSYQDFFEFFWVGFGNDPFPSDFNRMNGLTYYRWCVIIALLQSANDRFNFWKFRH
jgi:hypothetical protein